MIFYTNGYKTWFWDDLNYPPRESQGFYKKDELQLLIQRRTKRKDLAGEKTRKEIVNRYYQEEAIRGVVEAFQRRERKALIVMATGAGKTRTVIALGELLQRCNWAKRVLFLADRVALVKQAVNAFKKHLPDSNPVNLVTEHGAADSRVYVCTYPTMMGLINQIEDGARRFGVGHFPREGITYDELTDEEKERWDEIEWDEDGAVPDQVDPAALNSWLFNKDTVDKVLRTLMLKGLWNFLGRTRKASKAARKFHSANCASSTGCSKGRMKRLKPWAKRSSRRCAAKWRR